MLTAAILLAVLSPTPTILTASVEEYKCVVEVGHIQRNFDAWSWWGGSGGGGGLSVVKSLSVTFNGQTAWVPRSAYNDLAEPTSLAMREVNGGCEITLRGGDADSSYRMDLTMKGLDATHRVVASGEFPKHHNEKTSYTNEAPPEF